MGRPHEKLDAWQEAMALVRTSYVITQSFPREEIYGLAAQMRRAAISIPSNLAEGAARASRREFGQFISIATGSLSELETQFMIAVDLGYLARDHEVFPALERVAKLVAGLRRKVVA